MGRVVWFQASRWDARTSVDRQVAVEGGYSTKDAWLVRVQGDFPRLAPGWRLQAIGQAEKDAAYYAGVPATRQAGSIELTRLVAGPVSVALRGDATHVTLDPVASYALSPVSETEYRGRIALVVDQRDREYDTRRGSLFQVGGFLSSVNQVKGWYALASGWLPLSAKTRITVRAGARIVNESSIDGIRIMPAWEDEFILGGGPESNRGLPIGSETNTKVLLASAEIRHDLFVFPGGAVVLLAFVDGGRGYCDCDQLDDFVPPPSLPSESWTFGPGGGIAIRLLRNAVLTATVGVAHGKARVYVSSGWSW